RPARSPAPTATMPGFSSRPTWHAVARRGGRAEPARAIEAAADPGGAPLPAGGRHERDPGRRAGDCGHEPRLVGVRWREKVPRGPLLSADRVRAGRAAAAP